MSLIRISWQGKLTHEQKEMLNDAFNLMGMQAAADEGLIPQEDVDKESKRLEEKWPSNE